MNNVHGRRARPSFVRLALVSGVGLAGLIPATPILAQQAEAQGSVLDETIVVTARKREESIQSTPISITAFSGRGLEARGIQNTESLSNITTNLTLQNNPLLIAAEN